MDQSDALDQPTPSKCSPAMRRLGPALGYLLAAVGLVWILYDIRLEKLLGHLTKINWWWVALAIVSDFLFLAEKCYFLLDCIATSLSAAQPNNSTWTRVFAIP
jgi:hypothetical protein